LLCLPLAASAETPSGGDVLMELRRPTGSFGSVNVTVGSGIEFDLDGTTFDLNRSDTGNLLVMDGDGFGTLGAVSSLIISDMILDDGSVPDGFIVTRPNLSNLSIGTTDDSLTFVFDNGTASPDGAIILEGSYVISDGPGAPSPIPLPATAPLLLLAAGGLAALRRRRAKA